MLIYRTANRPSAVIIAMDFKPAIWHGPGCGLRLITCLPNENRQRISVFSEKDSYSPNPEKPHLYSSTMRLFSSLPIAAMKGLLQDFFFHKTFKAAFSSQLPSWPVIKNNHYVEKHAVFSQGSWRQNYMTRSKIKQPYVYKRPSPQTPIKTFTECN